MFIKKGKIDLHNSKGLTQHNRLFAFASETVPDISGILQKLQDFQILKGTKILVVTIKQL